MDNFENHFLIAMPSLNDPFFHRTVTYICEHNKDGAMGLIINQPTNLTVSELLEQIKIEINDKTQAGKAPVFSGGPVQTDRGFVLHSPQECWNSSLQLSGDIMITTSKDILASLASEQGPNKFLVTLGYAGWGAGQLEKEIAENSWLTLPADSEILFDTPTKDKYEKAAEKLGINIWQVSNDVGHA
ncbi:YqgE/AlgH family protein [Flocculibacter collagenilyticus]|uniref:YqgE/AlgH family protein n=1 Tax=Flocculibacter collagenilyticus TaxID=2744479 RepID=UPI0018F49F98|nr:YqgE/AlgH family protein [Flocculibacter collagenilyticus]